MKRVASLPLAGALHVRRGGEAKDKRTSTAAVKREKDNAATFKKRIWRHLRNFCVNARALLVAKCVTEFSAAELRFQV